MKYVYTNSELNRNVPNNAANRFLIGIGFSAVSLFCMLGAVISLFEDFLMAIAFLGVAHIPLGIGFLFIFFAFRTKRAILNAKTREPEDVIDSDTDKKFYSSQCPNCKVLIDYQKSDLAFRPWLLRGYVECPCCLKPIRHDPEKNVFIPHRYPETSE